MSRTAPKRRWSHLLEDADVERWHASNHRSSACTAREYLRALGRCLEAIRHTPQSVLVLDQKGRDDAVSDAIGHFEAPPDGGPALAPGTIHVYHTALVSWLHWNGFPPKRKFKIANRGWQPHAETFNILSQEQVRRVYHVAGARARVAGAMLHFTGMRPEVLGWIDGSKGLQLRHLPELDITPEGFEVQAMPMRIDVPRDLNKGRRAYTTFLGAQGTAYLLAYLESRRNAGEALGPESPVLADYAGRGRFLTTKSVSSLIRRAFDKAGIPEPPYILKSVWMNRAINAEADGFTSTYRTFCVGHAGTLAHTYGMRKRLDAETLEQLRSAYAAALRYLETETAATTEDPLRAFWSLVLEELGDEDAPKEDLQGKSEEEIRDLVAQRFQEVRAQAPAAEAATRQEVVPLGDVGARLGLGWRFVANLGDGTAIVEGT